MFQQIKWLRWTTWPIVQPPSTWEPSSQSRSQIVLQRTSGTFIPSAPKHSHQGHVDENFDLLPHLCAAYRIERFQPCHCWVFRRNAVCNVFQRMHFMNLVARPGQTLTLMFSLCWKIRAAKLTGAGTFRVFWTKHALALELTQELCLEQNQNLTHVAWDHVAPPPLFPSLSRPWFREREPYIGKLSLRTHPGIPHWIKPRMCALSLPNYSSCIGKNISRFRGLTGSKTQSRIWNDKRGLWHRIIN